MTGSLKQAGSQSSGVSDRVVIYFPWITPTIYVAIVCGFISWLLRAYPPVVWAVPLVFVARSAAERRRKIVLSNDSVEYWPVFGRQRKISFVDVISVEFGTMASFFVFEGYLHSCAWIQLRNGERQPIPLDLPEPERVFQEIVKSWDRRRDNFSNSG